MAENFDLQEYIENLGEQYFWSAEYGKMIVKSDSEGVIDPNEATSSNQTPRLTESNLVNKMLIQL
ncbi:hypothetical protein M569_05553 [Genlisea aurea]|uniref:Uncharacterized protein n=1 Tax=Genlisea aurea TaxID=192259 RepID=S8CPU2_9LAMI|nr:hypothetical protein M569_05553 [Genlisea aurea]